MDIQSISLRNFRTVSNLEISLSDYTLLVGANNAGKCNVVDALRWFLGK